MAIQGLISRGVTSRHVPLRFYCGLTLIFFVLSIVNNKALDYDISMPIHMMFRASSLVASLTMGYFIFGKRYTIEKVIGVCVVTCGIITITFADASRFASSKACCDNEVDIDASEKSSIDASGKTHDMSTWFIGVGMLSAALFMSATLGHLQEWSYRTYSKDGVTKSTLAAESKMYSHLIALPLFLTQGRDIQEHAELFLASEPLSDVLDRNAQIAVTLPKLLGDIPILYVYLIINVFTQYICITGVYRLTAVSSTLTCTLTLTVRKALSLIVSVIWFSHEFSRLHWTGTCLVFFGVLLYCLEFRSSASQVSKKKVD